MVVSGSMNWEEMEWELVRPGVKRKVFQAEGCTVVLNSLDPGHEPRPHAHAQQQIVYILKGEVDFTVGSEVFRLTSGSLLTIPPDTEHFARVLGREPCIDLDVFVPGRADYVQSRIISNSLSSVGGGPG